MNKGDCFWGDIDGGTNEHYWIVLCDPKAGQIALVNFTTGCGGPKSQKVSKAFFDTLKYDSELAWFESVVRDDTEIVQMVNDSALESKIAMPVKKIDTLMMIARSQGLVPVEVDKILKS
ncbi:MAG: hypothetical protein HYV95_11305 [Opitutae bacterium]|nr:hypothetical protein [Opitutae bacterium]